MIGLAALAPQLLAPQLLALQLSVWGCAAHQAGTPAPAESLLEQPQRPQDPSELVYFVMVDRFADGAPDNNQASAGPAVDRTDPQGWHGGDLRGVINHLDDIASLGVTTLWLSPVFATRTQPIGGWGAYHGYWQWDPTTVEPRFGSREDLVELAEGLRQRGMGLLLDLVTNHVGYGAPLEQSHPDWFHSTPSIEDWQDPVQLETWQVHGLPDLNQDNPQVATWLTSTATAWQTLLQPRGFRVDAVRHVPNAFLKTLGHTLVTQQPDSWWLGEDFTGDVTELADSQRSGGFSHVFDFPLYYAMTDVFCDDAPPARLASVLWQDQRYDRPAGLVTFLDNHDLPRIQSRCHGDGQRVQAALRFLFATRGVPALTYGTESQLLGAEEPANRGDMVFAPQPLRPLIVDLAHQRAATPAMRKGIQRVIHLDSDSMALARVSDRQAVVVGVNRSDQPVSLRMPPALKAAALSADPLTIPAHDVAVWVLPGQVLDWSAQGPRVDVAVEVRGAPAGEVRVVGADASLGSWQPDQGLALSCTDELCRGSLQVPEGAVLEGKIVVSTPGPSGESDVVTWADGENQAVLAASDTIWRLSW